MANKETIRKRKYEPKSLTKGGKLSHERRLEVMESIKDSYLRHGTINKSELSRELKVSRPTMMSLINDMEIEMESLPTIQLELKLIFERIKNRLIYLWDKLIEVGESTGILDIKNELAIIKEMKDTLQNFYSLLQEFGEAPKTANKVEIEGNVKTINTQINYFQNNNILTHIESSLEGVVDERQKQQIIVDIMEKSKNETTTE